MKANEDVEGFKTEVKQLAFLNVFLNFVCSCRATLGKKNPTTLKEKRAHSVALSTTLPAQRQWPSLINGMEVLLVVPLATKNRCWCMEMISCRNSGNKTCFTAFQLWEEVKAPKMESRQIC